MKKKNRKEQDIFLVVYYNIVLFNITKQLVMLSVKDNVVTSRVFDLMILKGKWHILKYIRKCCTKPYLFFERSEPNTT